MQDVCAETRQIRPLIGAAKAHLAQNIGMVGGKVAFEEHGFIGIRQGHLTHRIHARGGAPHRHIADIVFIDLERQFGVQGLRVKPRSLGKGLIEQRF